MDSIHLRACAKINLGLDVVRRRPDGYHDVRMIMQMLSLCDEVTVKRTAEPGIRLNCDLAELPCDASNIAWRAAAAVMERFGLQEGVLIDIRKHIPLAAGMAGGSTDCAVPDGERAIINGRGVNVFTIITFVQNFRRSGCPR